MTCREVREYLFAFLDNELDAPLSIDLQRHLERCPHCAREAEIERAVTKRLGAALAAGIEVGELDESRLTGARWAGGVEVPTPAPSGGSHRGAKVLAWAACIGLVLTGAFWLVTRGGAARARHDLAALLVADFQHFLDEGGQVQLASADSATVSDWLRAKTELPVKIPAPKDRNCKLVGARKCKIAGKPAAFAVYDMHGVRASLVVVNRERMSLERMSSVGVGGVSHWVDRREGVTVLACPRDRLVYAVVSTLPEHELRCLMDHHE